MPLFEYRCGDCGRSVERLRKAGEAEGSVSVPCLGPVARECVMQRAFPAPARPVDGIYSYRPAAAKGE
jgi:hypothetical protein